MSKYYFCSSAAKGLSMILTPRIPESAGDDEDKITKRICVSQSILGALSGIGQNIYGGQDVYVYECDVSSDEVYEPSSYQVPDVMFTGERWILKDTIFYLSYVMTVAYQAVITDPMNNNLVPIQCILKSK